MVRKLEITKELSNLQGGQKSVSREQIIEWNIYFSILMSNRSNKRAKREVKLPHQMIILIRTIALLVWSMWSKWLQKSRRFKRCLMLFQEISIQKMKMIRNYLNVITFTISLLIINDIDAYLIFVETLNSSWV